jgi:hypothetical protein
MRTLIAEDPEAPPLEVLRRLREEGHRLGESTFYRLHRAEREGLPKELMVRFEGVAGDSSGSGTSDSRDRASAATPSASIPSAGWRMGGPVRVLVTEQHLEPTLRDLSEALIAVYGTDYGIHSPTWISRAPI